MSAVVPGVVQIPFSTQFLGDDGKTISKIWLNYFQSLNKQIATLFTLINNIGPNLIPIWSAGAYLAGYMVYEGSPVYFYVANKDTSVEPATDFYIYDPAVPYNPGTKSWTRYADFSRWIEFVNMNKYGP